MQLSLPGPSILDLYSCRSSVNCDYLIALDLSLPHFALNNRSSTLLLRKAVNVEMKLSKCFFRLVV